MDILMEVNPSVMMTIITQKVFSKFPIEADQKTRTTNSHNNWMGQLDGTRLRDDVRQGIV